MAHIGEELRLVLARLRKLAALVLYLFEETNILDCDDGLIGKRSHQLDLFGSERLWRIPAHEDYAHHLALAQERHAQRGSIAADSLSLRPGIVRIRQHVGEMHDRSFQGGSPSHAG